MRCVTARHGLALVEVMGHSNMAVIVTDKDISGGRDSILNLPEMSFHNSTQEKTPTCRIFY